MTRAAALVGAAAGVQVCRYGLLPLMVIWENG